MVLLGFVTMMIYGVAYHVIPRFAGAPLRSQREATVHWWMSNVGLALMVAGFALRAGGLPEGTTVLALGGVLSALGAYLFVFLIWRTVDGPPGRRRAAAAATATAARRPAPPVLHAPGS
jgi:cbb3-type cytochrome oxidase subunit 1